MLIADGVNTVHEIIHSRGIEKGCLTWGRGQLHWNSTLNIMLIRAKKTNSSGKNRGNTELLRIFVNTCNIGLYALLHSNLDSISNKIVENEK